MCIHNLPIAPALFQSGSRDFTSAILKPSPRLHSSLYLQFLGLHMHLWTSHMSFCLLGSLHSILPLQFWFRGLMSAILETPYLHPPLQLQDKDLHIHPSVFRNHPLALALCNFSPDESICLSSGMSLEHSPWQTSPWGFNYLPSGISS